MPLKSVFQTLLSTSAAIVAHSKNAFSTGIIAALLSVFAVSSAQALTLTSNELVASTALGCVLADDALGYLSESEFNDRFDEAVEEFSEEQVDVIYAKALGYIDGLLYGVPSGDAEEASRRLLEFSTSQGCTGSYQYTNTSVSI